MTRDPDVFRHLLSGEIGLAVARRDLLEKTQKKHQGIRVHGTKREQERNQAAWRLLVDVLSNIRGLCRGVNGFNMQLLANMAPEEKNLWIQIAKESACSLTLFARRLKDCSHALNNNHTTQTNETNRENYSGRSAEAAHPPNSPATAGPK